MAKRRVSSGQILKSWRPESTRRAVHPTFCLGAQLWSLCETYITSGCSLH